MHEEWLECQPVRLRSFVQDKGFGFIQTAEGSDVFFHHSSVADQEFDNLTEGQQVEYSIEQGSGPKGKGRARLPSSRFKRLLALDKPAPFSQVSASPRQSQGQAEIPSIAVSLWVEQRAPRLSLVAVRRPASPWQGAVVANWSWDYNPSPIWKVTGANFRPLEAIDPGSPASWMIDIAASKQGGRYHGV